jgi:hypothetical protein
MIRRVCVFGGSREGGRPPTPAGAWLDPSVT